MVFVLMSGILVKQLFELQIIQGQDYISKFESRITKKRAINSTRGNIFDRNGEELASNVLAYSVTFEDNGTYDEEGPSMGGAMLAAVGCGAYPDVETIGKKFAKVVDTVEPDPELVAKYEERYQKFRTLYPAMKPLF